MPSVKSGGFVQVHVLKLDFHALPKVLKDVVEYWRALKGDRFAPTWAEIDMMRLPMELLPTTVVVDCVEDVGGPNYRYRYYGSGLRNIHNVELTGKTPDDLPVPQLSQVIKTEFRQVQQSRTPLYALYGFYEDHENNLEDGFLNVVRLPVSNDGKTVSHILSVNRYMMHDLRLNKMFKILEIPVSAERSLCSA